MPLYKSYYKYFTSQKIQITFEIDFLLIYKQVCRKRGYDKFKLEFVSTSFLKFWKNV